MKGLFKRLNGAWVNGRTLGESGKGRELRAFHPAVLELEATPPNPIVQWLARSIVMLLVLLLIWSLLGEITIVASAQGKILSRAQVKVIQPLQKSVIKRILVNEGEYVTKGQALIEVDSARTRYDENRLNRELIDALINLAVNEVLLEMLNRKEKSGDQIETDSLLVMKWSDDAGNQNSHFNKLLQEKLLQYPTRIAALDNALEVSDKEYEATKIKIIKLKKNLPIIARRVKVARDLYEKKYVSETEYRQLERTRIEKIHRLAVEKQHLTQLQAMREQAQRQVVTLKTETMTGVLSEIAHNRREIAALQEELVKAENMNHSQIIYAPVSGQVRELAENTEGSIVTKAESLMKILPNEGSLVVEAFLENKDIRYVENAMPAQVKIHAVPFTKYGIIEAEVDTISDDAIFDEKRGFTYSMLLEMKKTTIAVEGKEVRLVPGMEVTAEVKTGERRLIEYLLAPLLRQGEERLRER
jgi:hemolysin D